MPEKTPDLDHLLGKGLEAWADIEPSPGLEERLLIRLRREPATAPVPEGTTRRGPWLLLAAAVLLVAAAGVVRIRSASPRIATTSLTPPREAPARENVVTPVPAREALPPARVAAAGVPAARPPLPGRPSPASPVRKVFPSPSPLAEEDRLLIAYVAATPLEELMNNHGFLDAPAGVSDETKENR
ncbi:MAG TPA: hypothetical protein VL084_11425 [Thermoanaerobaculia bacterium]|nr:hypothetical protein [Thermoanaerobaculia bacterium]